MKTENKLQHTQGEARITARDNQVWPPVRTIRVGSICVATIEGDNIENAEANALHFLEAWNTLAQNKKKLELFEEMGCEFEGLLSVVEDHISEAYAERVRKVIRKFNNIVLKKHKHEKTSKPT